MSPFSPYHSPCCILLKYILLIMLLQVSDFFSTLYSLLPCTPLPPSSSHRSSCPWVIHGNSSASPFLILFLTSPVYFVPTIYASYSLYLFPHSPSSHSLTDNPPCDLHFCRSVPVLVVCLVFVFLGSVVDSCEFVVILLFIFLIFFFLDKSL